MANGCHIEKVKNGHIFTTIRPIYTKFGMVMHIGPPRGMGSYNFQLLKFKITGTAAILKNQKNGKSSK